MCNERIHSPGRSVSLCVVYLLKYVVSNYRRFLPTCSVRALSVVSSRWWWCVVVDVFLNIMRKNCDYLLALCCEKKTHQTQILHVENQEGNAYVAYMSACLLQQSKMRLNICSSNSPCVGRREEVMYIRVYLNSLVQQFTEKRRNSLVGLHVYYYSLCPVTDQRGTESQITQCCTCLLSLWQSAVTNGTRCSCLRSVVMMLFNISPVLHRRRKWDLFFCFWYFIHLLALTVQSDVKVILIITSFFFPNHIFWIARQQSRHCYCYLNGFVVLFMCKVGDFFVVVNNLKNPLGCTAIVIVRSVR